MTTCMHTNAPYNTTSENTENTTTQIINVVELRQRRPHGRELLVIICIYSVIHRLRVVVERDDESGDDEPLGCDWLAAQIVCISGGAHVVSLLLFCQNELSFVFCQFWMGDGIMATLTPRTSSPTPSNASSFVDDARYSLLSPSNNEHTSNLRRHTRPETPHRIHRGEFEYVPHPSLSMVILTM
jgi:hypothetical protein